VSLDGLEGLELDGDANLFYSQTSERPVDRSCERVEGEGESRMGESRMGENRHWERSESGCYVLDLELDLDAVPNIGILYCISRRHSG
jgi:hypothetical protein